jgi:hypothetical protein
VLESRPFQGESSKRFPLDVASSPGMRSDPQRIDAKQSEVMIRALMLPGNMQEIISGIQPGQPVVTNALVLQNTVEQ